MLEQFSGKRVLITGETGFKGSWLSLWLHTLGAEVQGLALPPRTREDHFTLTRLQEIVHHVDADIRDSTLVKQVFRRFQPEFVFHLAAQPLVRASYVDPKTTFDTNVGGSVNLLEAVRETDTVKVLVYVTSDKCYRNREWIWGYRENDELGGNDPYSASKAAAEIVFASYRESFFRKGRSIGAASVRAGNVIGGGDWAIDRIIPDGIRALREQRAIQVRNPGATRPWQHVLDPLHGYLTLAARLSTNPTRYSGSWNFGPDGSCVRNVGELVASMIRIWGSGSVELAPQCNAPEEAQLLQLNCEKAHQELRWRPLWDFDRAVHETVTWYRKWHEGNEALDLSIGQIQDHMRDQDNLKSAEDREAVMS
jgi:CDP-glucose 4,6-dehydratase